MPETMLTILTDATFAGLVNSLVGLRPKSVLRQALSAVGTPYVNR